MELKQIGITKNEEEAFEFLLKHPNSTAAVLSRQLNMDKSSAYRAVDGLVIKGIVKANVRKRGSTYEVVSPDSLLQYFKTKKAEFESKGSMLENYVSKLKKEMGLQRSTNITIEKGLDNHIKRMEESLSSKEKVIRERFRNHPIFQEDSYVTYVKSYAQRRRDAGIFIYQLEQDFGKMYEVFPEIMKDYEYYLKDVRKLPKKMSDNNSLRVYDDVINIMSYDENEEFIVITIKDKYIAELMKNMYDVIWDVSEPVIEIS